jgi:hypothetical protein
VVSYSHCTVLTGHHCVLEIIWSVISWYLSYHLSFQKTWGCLTFFFVYMYVVQCPIHRNRNVVIHHQGLKPGATSVWTFLYPLHEIVIHIFTKAHILFCLTCGPPKLMSPGASPRLTPPPSQWAWLDVHIWTPPHGAYYGIIVRLLQTCALTLLWFHRIF